MCEAELKQNRPTHNTYVSFLTICTESYMDTYINIKREIKFSYGGLNTCDISSLNSVFLWVHPMT